MRSKILFLFMFIFIGCSNIEEDFKIAQRENSIDAYSNFLQKYPNSKYTRNANLAIAKISLRNEYDYFKYTESKIYSDFSELKKFTLKFESISDFRIFSNVVYKLANFNLDIKSHKYVKKLDDAISDCDSIINKSNYYFDSKFKRLKSVGQIYINESDSLLKSIDDFERTKSYTNLSKSYFDSLKHILFQIKDHSKNVIFIYENNLSEYSSKSD